MLVFLVTCRPEGKDVGKKISEVYSSAFIKYSEYSWLVADKGVTAQEVCEKVNVKDGGISGVIAFRVSDYYGFGPSNYWEWIKVKLSAE